MQTSLVMLKNFLNKNKPLILKAGHSSQGFVFFADKKVSLFNDVCSVVMDHDFPLRGAINGSLLLQALDYLKDDQCDVLPKDGKAIFKSGSSKVTLDLLDIDYDQLYDQLSKGLVQLNALPFTTAVVTDEEISDIELLWTVPPSLNIGVVYEDGWLYTTNNILLAAVKWIKVPEWSLHWPRPFVEQIAEFGKGATDVTIAACEEATKVAIQSFAQTTLYSRNLPTPALPFKAIIQTALQGKPFALDDFFIDSIRKLSSIKCDNAELCFDVAGNCVEVKARSTSGIFETTSSDLPYEEGFSFTTNPQWLSKVLPKVTNGYHTDDFIALCSEEHSFIFLISLTGK